MHVMTYRLSSQACRTPFKNKKTFISPYSGEIALVIFLYSFWHCPFLRTFAFSVQVSRYF